MTTTIDPATSSRSQVRPGPVRERPASADAPAFVRHRDKVGSYSRLPPSELQETAASIRNFVESKGRSVDFVFNGRPGNAMSAFGGVSLDLPMSEHGNGRRLFIHISPFDGVSSRPKLTEGQLTASLTLARSALMEANAAGSP